MAQTMGNFIHRYAARIEALDEETITKGDAAVSYQNITYFDGLGRPKQEILRNAAGGNGDIIYPMVYDGYGRQVKTCLPYPDLSGTSNGHFRLDAINKQAAYYSSRFQGDRNGYAETLTEPSPLNRLEKQAAAGRDWKMGSGKEMKFSRRPNSKEDAVRIFTLDSLGLPLTRSIYRANALWVEITDNEDNHRTMEFTDKRGRTLLKKVQNTALNSDKGHQGWLCTYYVYDDLDNLRTVIPPKAVAVLESKGWHYSSDSSLAAEQYFTYKYDRRRRLTEKQVPGKGKEYLLYDQQDRLVATQDGEMRKETKWLYTRYDALGREVMTGMIVDGRERKVIQKKLMERFPENHVKAIGNRDKIRSGEMIVSSRNDGYEPYVGSKAIILKPGFFFKATDKISFVGKIGDKEKEGSGGFPAMEGEILTVSYYDSYEATPAGLFKGRPGFPSPSSQLKGLLTARKVKNLASGKFYTTTYFYDEKGRLIQTLEEHHLGGTIRISMDYNFEGQLTASYTEFNIPNQYTVAKTYAYNQAGLLSGISHQLNGGSNVSLVNYGYNELGEKITVTFPNADVSTSYAYNIRGWLKEMGSQSPQLFKMMLNYQETGIRWDGNITQVDWWGKDGVARRYDYAYDKPGRISSADYQVPALPSENSRYSLSNISYDENGNLKTLTRMGQRSPGNYQVIDELAYQYTSDPTLGEYGNRLMRVKDKQNTPGYTSKDFKPNALGGNYGYDANGNQVSQADKNLSEMNYNHLNLPESMVLTTGEKMHYAYDAGGNKRQQRVIRGQKQEIRTDYVGDFIWVDGQLDHLLHEEGRVVFEKGQPQYEFFLKDHLGNVRQVIRKPEKETHVATMEMDSAKEEDKHFEQIASSRQFDPAHNVTAGGNRVAWLNASRGRILGPTITREVKKGGKVALKVHGKYEAPLTSYPSKAGILGVWASRPKLLDNLQEFGKVTVPQLSVNPFWVLSMVDLLAKSLQTKEAPEAYMMYALYDQDSIPYATGKQILTKNAANRHEILEEEVYIAEDGYIQAFLVNETEAHVWFDDFTIMNELPTIVQETHYGPWGLELTGLGYQNEAKMENKYLYNGKEHIPDLNLYDYGARMYDPVLGRWMSADPMADHPKQIDISPYAAMWNNPVKYTDPDGMMPCENCPEFEILANRVENQLGFIKDGIENSVRNTDKMVNKIGVSLTNFMTSLDNKFSNGGSGNSHSSNQFSGDDSNVRKGRVEHDISIDAFILPYLRMDPATNPVREFLQGIEIGTAIMDIGTESINSDRSSDTTYISGSGRNNSDGTVSVKMVVNGDTINYQTRDEEESINLKTNSNGKWSY